MRENYTGSALSSRSGSLAELTALVKKLGEEIGCLRVEIASLKNEVRQIRSARG